MSGIRIILSYRKNRSKTNKPDWDNWRYTSHAPIDNPLGVAQIVEQFNAERNAFSKLEYRLDVGEIGSAGMFKVLDQNDVVKMYA
tara:strand:+ start:145 stop:399 length:255 start_codon:yes stop_codon:yes gene_type:complete